MQNLNTSKVPKKDLDTLFMHIKFDYLLVR